MPHVTIIETGIVSPRNRERHGSYPQMFEQMIGAADASVTFDTVSIPAGEPLPDIGGLEAILITGLESGHGVDIDEKLAAKYPYKPAYLPVARLQDGTMWSW